MKNYSIIFCTAYAQIFLVSVQTWHIAHLNSVSYVNMKIFCGSILISAMWLININAGIKNCRFTKIYYTLGAAFGAVCGPYIGDLLA